MSSLINRSPLETYGSILKIEQGGLTTTLQTIEDGFGTASPFKIATTSISIHDLTFPSTGATPGRLLAVAEDGTSMKWIDAPTGTPGEVTEKGTISVSDGESVVGLAIGTSGQVLVVDTTQPAGIKWVTLSRSGVAIPDSTTYSYRSDGTIETVTEIIGGDSMISTYAYNSNGSIQVITITFQGTTRQETYQYVDGRVSSMTSTYL